ncbi:putative enzyme [Hyella patelloides LEGE 07179]|uniref:Pseudouridine synthase n=1 Tax=Hyella patelloides LEGE 07179 TaxID=945734 RepID=A0A563VQR7_9CYAN|nr:pseudouridine synthase [Hyella patelloides]VEP13751.1 putative enzyme [Hyella patelloides LEGE 07179]
MKCILFYKPYNVLCQFTDRNETTKRNTLKDYISIPNIYPVGRLDSDSEGLLLLTDNGQLQHRLAHRKFAHPRTYWVQVERVPNEIALQKLRQGIKIKDYITRPAKAKILSQEPALPPRNPPIRYRKTVPTCWLEINLTEGRNRQVRRMTAVVGFPTLRLVRVAMGINNTRCEITGCSAFRGNLEQRDSSRRGNLAESRAQTTPTQNCHYLSLGQLQPGEWRELNSQEKLLLQKLV